DRDGRPRGTAVGGPWSRGARGARRADWADPDGPGTRHGVACLASRRGHRYPCCIRRLPARRGGPSESSLAVTLRAKLDDVVLVMLLPIFFAYTGMRTELQLVSGVQNWAYCVLIVVVACAGKVGGTFFAARRRGLPWRDASALGVLMNTRGLVQLVVLNIGLDLHVISPTLFAMIVVMAVVTTFTTTPALKLILSTDSRSVAVNTAAA